MMAIRNRKDYLKINYVHFKVIILQYRKDIYCKIETYKIENISVRHNKRHSLLGDGQDCVCVVPNPDPDSSPQHVDRHDG